MKPAKITSKPASPTKAKPVTKAVKAAAVQPVVSKPAAPKAKPAAPTVVKSAPAEPTHEAIALRAYQIWEKNGRPSGREAEHWSQALAQLKAAN